MINLVTTVENLTLSECAQIWHIANKFQNHQIFFHIGFENDPTQHHLTSLIYKLDWEKQKHNPNLEFRIYFKRQLCDLIGFQNNVKTDLIEEYLKNHLGVDYAVYVNKDIIFSQKSTPMMWKHIDQKTNWYCGGSLVYGKNLQTTMDWVYLHDYPLVEKEEQLTHYESTAWPPIAIFKENFRTRVEYIRWKNFITEKYLDGTNLFHWEKRDV